MTDASESEALLPAGEPVPPQSSDVFVREGELGKKVNGIRMDRYTSLTHVMGWFGDVFTADYFDKYWEKLPLNKAYPKESKPLHPGDEYSVFVSYRWAIGRLRLGLVFASYFGFPILMGFVCLVVPIVMAVLYGAIEDSCPEALVMLSNGTRVWGHRSLPLSECADYDSPSWSWLPAIWLPVGLVLLYFGAQGLWFARKVFLDRLVINQEDKDIMTIGIKRLPLYLKNSKQLCCVLDQDYMTRMWCVFELAMYGATRKDGKITFICVAQEIAGIVTITFYWLIVFFWWFWSTEYRTRDVDDSTDTLAFAVKIPSEAIIRIFFFWASRELFKGLDAVAHALHHFNVVHAQLGAENDRYTLLHEINRVFGWENQSQRIASFFKHQEFSNTEELVIADYSMRGVALFNVYVRWILKQTMPLVGVRSCKFFRYIPAVLMGAPDMFRTWDYWAMRRYWHVHVASGSTEYGVRLVFVSLFDWFVMVPFQLYLMGVVLKLLWELEKHVRVPYWRGKSFTIPWWSTLILFLVIEIIVPIRDWLVIGLVGRLIECCFLFIGEQGGIDNRQPRWTWAFPTNPMIYSMVPAWRVGGDATFILPGAARPFAVIWLVVVFLFTFYVYEPDFVGRARLRVWDSFLARMKWKKVIKLDEFLYVGTVSAETGGTNSYPQHELRSHSVHSIKCKFLPGMLVAFNQLDEGYTWADNSPANTRSFGYVLDSCPAVTGGVLVLVSLSKEVVYQGDVHMVAWFDIDSLQVAGAGPHHLIVSDDSNSHLSDASAFL